MYGVGANYMTPDQYNQMMQNGMNQYNNMYGNMGMQSQGNMGMNNTNRTMNQNMMQILKGRPVSSADEARASMIDMDGSLFVFTDVANKRIYTKQIMLDGTADFKSYVLVEEPKQNIVQEQTKAQPGEYVLKSDFENTIDLLVKKIKTLEGKKNVTILPNDGAEDDAE